MGNFKIAYDLTAHNEGGYSNDQSDHGGETFAGISRKFWPKWTGWPLIDAYKKQHGLTNINSLLHDAGMITFIQAFYKANFWDVLRLDQISNQQVANQIYDMAVNSGAGKAAEYMQRIVHVTIDMRVGNETIMAVNGMDAEKFYNAFIGLRKAFYDRIIANDPSQAKFKTSWYSRLTPFKK